MRVLEEIDKNVFYTSETKVELDRDSYEWLLQQVRLTAQPKHEYDDIVTAINTVLNDKFIDTAKKLERIDAYVGVYIDNNTHSMSDMV